MAYGYNNTPPPTNYGQTGPQNQMPIPNQNVQPLFPQPQGNVYNINSTLEVANVPVGAGVSVALCMPENVMFIKTMQNGNPLFYPYKIVPFNTEAENQPTSNSNPNGELINQIKECLDRIGALEDFVKNKKKGVEFAV